MNATLLPVFILSATALENLVEQTFGLPFDVKLSTGQDGILEYRVTGRPDPVEANRLRAGRRTRSVLTLLNTLAADNLIPCGTYRIVPPKAVARTSKSWNAGRLNILTP